MKDDVRGARRRVRRIAPVVVGLLLSVPLPGFGDAFTVTRSDASGLTIDFRLPPVVIEERAGAGQTGRVLRAGGIPLDGDAGRTRLEMFHALIALPPGAGVEADLVPLETEDLGVLNPGPGAGDGRRSPVLEEEAIARGALEIGEPGLLRRQRVVSMRVFPFRVDPRTGRVRAVRRARIEVRFTGGRGEPAVPPAEDAFEGVYRRVLLNAGPARAWRVGPERGSPRRPSPFFEGERWLKVVVSDEGMYRVTYDDLLDTGVAPATIDPASFQLFYGGGRELPWRVDDPRPELLETAVEVNGAGDGTFDPGDEIVFYGQALERWDRQQAYLRHRYDDAGVYWLTWGNPDAGPLRIRGVDGTPGGGGVEIGRYRDRKHVEQDNIYATEEFEYQNIVPDDWVWESVSGPEGVAVTRSYPFQLDETEPGDSDSLRLEIYGQENTGAHSVQVSVNGVPVREITFTGEADHNTGWFELPEDVLQGGSNTLTLILPRNTPSTADDAIYMGWFEVDPVLTLDGAGDERVFNGQRGGGVYRYRLGGVTASSPLLYRITDAFAPEAVTGFTAAGGAIEFELAGGTDPDRFIFLDRGRLRRPSRIEIIEDLTLRATTNAADYMVITAPELEGEAQELAMYRAGRNGFVTKVVTSDRIYDEFAWGVLDVTAYRDFLKYAFENWAVAPSMVVFLGDGHYDYKGFTSAGRGKANLLPPHINQDLVIEDWFVRLDFDSNPDMIYGRIPVRTNQEARAAIDKIMGYETDPEFGSWRSRVALVADDFYVEGRRCETLPHTNQTEDIDQRMPDEPQRVKLYLLEYPFDPPETGLEKPAATDDIVREWNRGALLINYVGHGSYRTWAHEKAFHQPDDFPRLENGRRLPMIVAASCEIGRFDDPAFDGMVEDMLKVPGKGMIAAFSATRATFSSPNRTVNNNLIDEIFADPFSSPYLGAAAINAKIRAGGSNASRYTLFGDPATKLALPGHAIDFTDRPDSLRPLGTVTLSGEVAGLTGSADGFVEIRTFDPPVRKVYVEECTTTAFQTSGNSLFNGVVSLENGRFSATFRVPANVPASLPPDTTALDNARIYAYVSWPGGDAYGAVGSIPVSLQAAVLADSSAPSIRLTSNGRELTGGDALATGQEIRVEIFDESGINVTGAPGHQILVEVDGGRIRDELTESFRYDVDSSTGGSLRYTVPDFDPGVHHFSFRASDNALNVARAEVDLELFARSEVRLSEVLIYPNPFQDRCYFTFEVSQPSEITIRIYTVAGRMVRRLERSVGAGYNQIEWDGRDWRGDRPANGVYLCHVTARSMSDGGVQEAEQLGKALLVR